MNFETTIIFLKLIKGTHLSNFAGKNVSEGRERVVHGLIIDALVQVLDEDVTDAGTSETGVTLTPHDADWTTLQHIKVHRVQSTLGCCETKQNCES